MIVTPYQSCIGLISLISHILLISPPPITPIGSNTIILKKTLPGTSSHEDMPGSIVL